MSISIKNLSKRFGKKIVFYNFSYEFSDTGIYILRGDSGIGKTTLLRMIAGLDVEFDGSIDGGGLKNVSFAFQEYRLFPSLSVLENVLVASKDESAADALEAKKLLTSLGFSEPELSRYPNELSGGMKQRVSLCRAFLKKSSVLLLDEPTKELDRALCDKLCEIIKEISKERLVIVVTHREEDAAALGGTEIRL